MSSTVHIGDSHRKLEDATAQWITEQIIRRRQAGEAVCIRVNLEKQNMRVTLASADCHGGGGGGRPPNKEEAAVIAEWTKRGLDGNNIPPGQLIAFLNQVC